jgi:hypothetical protein
LNAYGDPISIGMPPVQIDAEVSFIEGESWKNDITGINNARYFQFRITFISNPASNLTPELRTLAFAYFKTDPSL